jgi:hypothetical protein
VGEHLQIGFAAIGLLKLEREPPHSRKLRSFDEPPLRYFGSLSAPGEEFRPHPLASGAK